MSASKMAVEEALAAFSKIARDALHRIPLEVPEATESMSWRDIAFIRWGLRLLERDPTFAQLVKVVDDALLEEHRAVMGEGFWPIIPIQNQERVIVSTLDQHVRCFLRNSGAYAVWLRKKELEPGACTAKLLAEIRRPSVTVHRFVWLEGINRPGRAAIEHGSCSVLGFDPEVRSQVVECARSCRLYFWDRLAFDPTHLKETEMLYFQEELPPAAILRRVSAFREDRVHFTLNFAEGREAFPRRSWPREVDQALDGIRLFNWCPHHVNSPGSEYSPPSLRSMLVLHDGFLFQPFVQRHTNPVQMQNEFSQSGEVVDVPAVWIQTSDEEFDAAIREAGELGRLRTDVNAEVEQWKFIDQAFHYLRKSEDTSGYEQFVLAFAVVDCLIGQGKEGTDGHKRFMKRWANLTRTTPDEPLESINGRLYKLYDLRSRFVHGDAVHDDIIEITQLYEMNINARIILRRIVRWLGVLKASSTPRQLPNKKALIQYLDALEDVAALNDVKSRHVGLRATPELTSL